MHAGRRCLSCSALTLEEMSTLAVIASLSIVPRHSVTPLSAVHHISPLRQVFPHLKAYKEASQAALVFSAIEVYYHDVTSDLVATCLLQYIVLTPTCDRSFVS